MDLLQLDSAGVRVTKVVRSPEGYLDIWGTLASTADVLVYEDSDPGGARIEQVTLQALQSGLSTLIGAPVTLEHPRGEAGQPVAVTSANWAQYAKGTVLDAKIVEHPVHEDEYNQEVHIRVSDVEAASKIDAREITELSPGYGAKKKTLAPGKLLQLKRVHNHVAITVEGRGENATMHLDSKYKVPPTPSEDTMKNGPENTDEAPKQEDAVETEVPSEDSPVETPQADSTMCAMCGGVDSAKMYEDSKLENERLQAQLDSMSLELDSLKQEKMQRDSEQDGPEMSEDSEHAPMHTDSKPKLTEHEIMVLRQEAVELAEVYKIEGMENMQTDSLRKEVVRAATKDKFREGRSQVYYDEMFDGILAKYTLNKQNSADHIAATVLTSRMNHDSAPQKPVDPILDGIDIVSTKEQREAFAGRKKK